MPNDTGDAAAETDARETSDGDDGAAAEGSKGSRGSKGRSSRRRRTPVWAETVVLFVVALAMALVIKTFFLQAFYIPSPSMEPGLIKNDRILVEKPSYWFGHPQRGDVIVFDDPANWLTAAESATPQNVLAKGLEKIGLYPSGGHLVKRVIGLPGDTIKCCDSQGRLIINGVPVTENKIFVIRRQATCDGPMAPGRGCSADWMVKVPAGELFVMGDNRSESGDSSAHLTCNSAGTCGGADAFVPESDVVGKVFTLVWPIKRFTFIGRPDVFKDVPDPS